MKEYDFIHAYQEDRAVVELDGKLGIIDRSGKEIVPPKYDFIRVYQEGRAVVRLDGKYGVIDGDGNIIEELK